MVPHSGRTFLSVMFSRRRIQTAGEHSCCKKHTHKLTAYQNAIRAGGGHEKCVKLGPENTPTKTLSMLEGCTEIGGKMRPKCDPNSPKWVPNGTKRDQKGPRGGPWGLLGDPLGSLGGALGSPLAPRGILTSLLGGPGCHFGVILRLLGSKMGSKSDQKMIKT